MFVHQTLYPAIDSYKFFISSVMSIFRYFENEHKDVTELEPAKGTKAEKAVKDYYKSMLNERKRLNRQAKKSSN